MVKKQNCVDTQLCHMDTDNFIVYIKTDNIYKDIVEDVKTRFGTSNYELNTLLPKEKNKKVIGVMKDWLGEKIRKEFIGLRAKTYRYWLDDSGEDKKAKDTKKYVTKRKPKFEDYKNCLEATLLENKINHLEKIGIDEDSLIKDHKKFIKTIN